MGAVLGQQFEALSQDIDEAAARTRKEMLVLGVIGAVIGGILSGGVGILAVGALGALIGFVHGSQSTGLGNLSWGLPSKRMAALQARYRAEDRAQQVQESVQKIGAANHITPEEYAVLQARLQHVPNHADTLADAREQALAHPPQTAL